MEKPAPDERIYPEHIYDPTRRRIAAELLQVELKKLFPSIPHVIWSETASDIADWWDGERVKLAPVMDFWDAFEAVFGGIKLTLLTDLLTAQNYKWEEVDLQLNELTTSVILPEMEDLPHFQDRTARFGDIAQYLADNPDERQRQLQISNAYSDNPEQDLLRIITVDDGNQIFVQDGNHRALRAAVQGQPTMPVYVVRTEGEPPRNFWVPTGNMLILARMYGIARETDSAAKVDEVKGVLKAWFDLSDIAKINFKHRIIGHIPHAEELAEGLI